MKTHPLYAAMKRRHDSYVKDWAAKAQNDAEYGGKDFEKTLRQAKNLIQRFGSPAFKRDLSETGMGNNPELLRFVWKIAKEMDRLAAGGKAKSEPKDWGKLFYPNFPNG